MGPVEPDTEWLFLGVYDSVISPFHRSCGEEIRPGVSYPPESKEWWGGTQNPNYSKHPVRGQQTALHRPPVLVKFSHKMDMNSNIQMVAAFQLVAELNSCDLLYSPWSLR